MFDQPERSRFTVIRRSRPRVLGCQPVVDADDGELESVCDIAVTHVISRCRIHIEAAAVYIQIDAPRSAVGGSEDSRHSGVGYAASHGLKLLG
jgi:hypothetical protein